MDRRKIETDQTSAAARPLPKVSTETEIAMQVLSTELADPITTFLCGLLQPQEHIWGKIVYTLARSVQ